MLKEGKFKELVAKDGDLKRFYKLQDNGFYKVSVQESERELLKDKFRKLGFSALNFTDSRSVYQFYNLARLWDDIQIALQNDIKMWHPATEPVAAAEVYEFLAGENFENELGGIPVMYDYCTIYAEIFGGNNGYLCDKENVLRDIKHFIDTVNR